MILVLFIVTVIGLAGAALLTFSDTSIRTTVALRDQAGDAYTADGAAQVAINNLSKGYGFKSPALFENAAGSTCFGSEGGTLNLKDFLPAANGRNETAPSSASIVCTADPETGVNATAVSITSANRPAQAIMTLGRTTGEDGINIEAPSTNPLAVKGPVKSNSNINVVSGALSSTAAVTAYGTCSGSIVSIPAKKCPTRTTLVDPGYASPATVVPTYQAVPADVPASCPGGVVTFVPGYYDNAIALTALMTGNGDCGGSTWWFKPGMYYFDFHNNTNDSDVYRGTAFGSDLSADPWGITADQWRITRGHLVAGTPADSDGNAIASPGASPTIPGSCQNPINPTAAAGVQFIFGGDSQLALGGSADAEICGTYHADQPPIGVFGLKSGTATPTTANALKMSTVTNQGNFTNATKASLVAQDTKWATWNKTTTTSDTSTITVSGYKPTAIPAGSIVKSATVRVSHGNSMKYVAADKLAVTLTPQGVTGSPAGPAITTDLPLTFDSAELKVDGLDIYGGGTSVFDTYVHDNGFTGADMAYAATLSHPGIENLDTIQIDITYVKPTFRKEKITTITYNCMSAVYTRSSSTACAVLSTSIPTMPFTGAFYIQGTTYTPVAAIDLTLSNATQPVLPFGVISRSLWVKENDSFGYSGPVIEIPDDTAGNDGAPIVILKVYVCPAKSTLTCSADKVDPAHPEQGPIEALRARARIDAEPSLRMTILSWSNVR